MQRKYRLKKRRTFNYVYRNGLSVSDKNLVLISIKSKYGLKVGFNVSKKVGKAVVRNKVRRRLKEAFRSVIEQVADKHNYVVVARPSCAEMDYNQLKACLIALLKKANVLKSDAS